MANTSPPPIRSLHLRRFVPRWLIFSAIHFAILMAGKVLLVVMALARIHGPLVFPVWFCVRILSWPLRLLNSCSFYQNLNHNLDLILWLLNSLLWGAVASGLYGLIERRRRFD